MRSERNVLTTSKFKRLVRPLLLKIHQLNNSYSKYPSLLNYKEKPSSKNSNAYTSTNYPLQTGKLNPTDSLERLEHLKPHISSELYQAYIEIFLIVKNVLTTVVKHLDDFPTMKLSALCCLKLGGTAVLASKSTYYKLNQLKLFDQNTIPPHLQVISSGLAEDFDEWFTLEGVPPTQTYLTQLFLGYLVHLLTTYLNLTLYLLIPVIVHWSWEHRTSNIHAQFHRTLFHEFWLYDCADYSRAHLDLLKVLGSEFFIHKETFWKLLKNGYWYKFITSLNLGNYEKLVLECFCLNDKICIPVGSVIPEDPFESIQHLNLIFEVVRRVPQDKHVNNTLVAALSQIITATKNAVENFEEPFVVIRSSLDIIKLFVRFWLSFRLETIFNSLYRGNDTMFVAILKLCQYLRYEAKELEMTNYHDITDLAEEIWLLGEVVSSLRLYYLEYEMPLYDGNINLFSSLLVELQEEYLPHNEDFEDYLNFLSNSDQCQLAQYCYHKYYDS